MLLHPGFSLFVPSHVVYSRRSSCSALHSHFNPLIMNTVHGSLAASDDGLAGTSSGSFFQPHQCSCRQALPATMSAIWRSSRCVQRRSSCLRSRLYPLRFTEISLAQSRCNANYEDAQAQVRSQIATNTLDSHVPLWNDMVLLAAAPSVGLFGAALFDALTVVSQTPDSHIVQSWLPYFCCLEVRLPLSYFHQLTTVLGSSELGYRRCLSPRV